MHQAHFWYPVAAAIALAGCATTSGQLAARIEKARQLTLAGNGQQSLAGLDVVQDARLDGDDWALFGAVHEVALGEAARRGASMSVSDKLYEGPAKEGPPVFSFLRWKEGRIDASGVPDERLRELAVESHWAGLQARLGAQLGEQALEGRNVFSMFAGRIAGYDAASMEPAALCRLADEVDTQAYDSAGLPATAAFDLDGTVWDGNVMDPFLGAIIDLELPKPQANPPLQTFLKTLEGIDVRAVERNDVLKNARLFYARATRTDLPKSMRVSAKDAFYNIVGLLAGVTVEEAANAATLVYEHGVEGYPPWSEAMFADADGCTMPQVIKKLQARGIEVFLLSATLDPLARAGAQFLGVPLDRAMGSQLEIRDGVYTGKVSDSTYYTKGAIVRQWLPAPPVLAFGDSPTSDFPMLLEATGAAFMINARPSLRERDQGEAEGRMVVVEFDGTTQDLVAAGSGERS